MCDVNTKDCKCYNAVMRTYESLSANISPRIALEAAQRVYRHHHPEYPKMDAHLTVERWVNENHVQ